MFKDNFQLHQDEHVIKYVRKHWIFFAADCVGMATLFLIPALIIFTLEFSGYLPVFNIFGISFASFLNIIVYLWGLFCWLRLAEQFTDNILDFWVITNKRIIESELTGLFKRKLATLELQDIEDITITDPGFLANYFGYGTLEVQTAGAENEFKASNVENPEEVQRIMFDAKLADEEDRKSFQRKSVEDVTHQIVSEDVEPAFLHSAHPDSHIPHDQRKDVPAPESEMSEEDLTKHFDWAHAAQKNDPRDTTTNLESVEDKYKKDIDNALKADEEEI